MALSRKHYRAVAGAIRKQVDEVNLDAKYTSVQRQIINHHLKQVAEDLALYFVRDNYNFRHDTFMSACGWDK